MSATDTTSPTFTILLPIHRPPIALPFAIATVLEQTRQDFELFVICDGAPAETAACAREFTARDSRIRAFVHPKGERNGELYRHQALQSARGKYVCQIADDDLWLPNHLDEMATLLGQVEFGNLLAVSTRPDGTRYCHYGDLARASHRQRMLESRRNFFGPTAAGYRLATYRRLPVGWSPAPTDIWSDLFMWRKFLSLPDIVCGTRFAVTSLHVAAYPRRTMSGEERAEENRRLLEEIRDPVRRDAFVQDILRQVMLRAQLTDRFARRLAAIDPSKAAGNGAQDYDEHDRAVIARINRLAAEKRKRKRATRSPIEGFRRLLHRIRSGMMNGT